MPSVTFQTIENNDTGSFGSSADHATTLGAHDQEFAFSNTQLTGIEDQDVQAALQSAKEIAQNVESDAEKTQHWIENAKLAIDIARVSLLEAGKLASCLQETAEDTAGKATAVQLGRDETTLGVMEQKVVEKANLVLDATDVVDKKNRSPVGNPLESTNHGDAMDLKRRAMTVQELMDECREQLLNTRSTLDTKALKTTAGLKAQAEDLVEDVDRTSLRAQESLKSRCTPPVDAEIILRGEAVAVDQASLDKIDGVASMHDDNSKDKAREETPVPAAEVLKKDGVVLADPVSLDKIDGLPQRSDSPSRLDETLETIALEEPTSTPANSN